MSYFTRLISAAGFSVKVNPSPLEDKTSQSSSNTISRVATQGMQFLHGAGLKTLSALDLIPKEVMVEVEEGRRIICQPSDGDCLFNSFISALRLIQGEIGEKWTFGRKSNEEIVPLLRKQAAIFLQQNLESEEVEKALEISVSDFMNHCNELLIKKLDAREEVSDEDLEKITLLNTLTPPERKAAYIRLMQKAGFFASNGEILALCKLFDVSVIIFCKIQNTYITNPAQQFNLEESEQKRCEIHLEYNPEKRHYSTIVPKSLWESPFLELRKIDPHPKQLSPQEGKQLIAKLKESGLF